MQLKRRMAYLIPWLTDFAGMLVIFTVGRDMAETNRSFLEMGLIGAIASLALGASSLVCGHLSDRFGRRRLIVVGSILVSISCALAWLRYYTLTYAVLGIGSGMIYPALVSWLTQGRRSAQAASSISRALIVFCLAWNLGMMAGQFFGGWLFEIDRLWPLRAAFGLAVVNLLAITVMHRPDPTGSEPIHCDQLLSRAALAGAFARLAWIANIGGAFSMSMVLHLFPKLAVSLHVPAEQHGTIVATMRLAVIGVYLLMHRVSFWHFRVTTALISQGIAAAGMVLLSFATTIAQLWLALVALAQLCGYNYFASLYYSTSGSTDAHRGAASGIHEATLALGFAAGSAVGGAIGQWFGAQAPYGFAAALIVVLACVQMRMYGQQVRQRSATTVDAT